MWEVLLTDTDRRVQNSPTLAEAILCTGGACRRTGEVSLGEQVLEELRVGGEQQVVQLVYAHAHHAVDVHTPREVSTERLHLT